MATSDSTVKATVSDLFVQHAAMTIVAVISEAEVRGFCLPLTVRLFCPTIDVPRVQSALQMLDSDLVVETFIRHSHRFWSDVKHIRQHSSNDEAVRPVLHKLLASIIEDSKTLSGTVVDPEKFMPIVSDIGHRFVENPPRPDIWIGVENLIKLSITYALKNTERLPKIRMTKDQLERHRNIWLPAKK